MKTFISSISPFLLLLIPIMIAAFVVCTHVDKEIVQERIELNASFIKVPKFLNVRAFLF
ncbi:hypothetical protein H8S90_06400 [Olivibacter sp. SDN3]|uniref:hypothetical protein n=1 Tax=Olivibacter sp. SDN3 TaxID=2764720 RepID=UPI0016518C49|nr:hypothetical protein [Olivibacter sp. SDN3]QNL51210.1 hypothetical protein H8S90_06400 [Olivibacter sp. SDN3]